MDMLYLVTGAKGQMPIAYGICPDVASPFTCAQVQLGTECSDMQSKATSHVGVDGSHNNPSSPSSSELITVPQLTDPSGLGMSIPVKKEMLQDAAFTLWDQDLDVSSSLFTSQVHGMAWLGYSFPSKVQKKVVSDGVAYKFAKRTALHTSLHRQIWTDSGAR